MSVALMVMLGGLSGVAGADQKELPRVIHITDLYRPPADPDDHFDLACAFALARQGYIDLAAVVVEAPPPRFPGDPDVMAVAQLNRLTGLAVPVVVGVSVEEAAKRIRPSTEAKRPVSPEKASKGPGLPGSEHRNKDYDSGGIPLLDLVWRARGSVVLFSTGSCRDVAVAFQEDPKLFSSQVDAVYVNAGLGSPEPAYQAPLEYNVALDPRSYQAMFDLLVPVYWLPCFEGTNTGLMWRTSRWASFYRFRQEEVFSVLAPPVQNYFLWMLESAERPSETGKQSPFWQSPTQWYRWLDRPVDLERLAHYGRAWRSMWCTAGQLHLAGLTVTRRGQIVPQNKAGDSAVFDFVPVQVWCNEQGITHWQMLAQEGSDQASSPTGAPTYILRIRDPQAYPAAMTKAMASLLQALAPANLQNSHTEKP